MIEYLYTERQKPCETEPLKVRLDGKICGEIRKVDTGYQYFPKGSKEGGTVYSNVREVATSLEEK